MQTLPAGLVWDELTGEHAWQAVEGAHMIVGAPGSAAPPLHPVRH